MQNDEPENEADRRRAELDRARAAFRPDVASSRLRKLVQAKLDGTFHETFQEMVRQDTESDET